MTAADAAPPSGPRRRSSRWLRRAGMGVVALVAVVAALVALLQLPPVATFVVRRLLTLAPLNPGNRLEVGGVSGNIFGGLSLEDVRLRQSGRELAYIHELRIGYRLRGLTGPVPRLDELEADGARITARRQGDRWDLLDVMRKASDTTGGGGFAVGRLRVRDAAVAARLSPDSVVRVRVLDLAARDIAVGDTTRLALDALELAVRPPAASRWLAVSTRGAVTANAIRLDPFRIHTELSELSGRIVMPRNWQDARQVDRLDVRLAGRPLDLSDLAAMIPSMPPTGQLRFDATAGADGNVVTGRLAATLDQATLTLDGGTTLQQGRPASYRVHGVVRGFDPSRVNTSAPAGTISGSLDADLTGPLRRTNGSARLRLADSKIGGTVVRRLDLAARLVAGTAELVLQGTLDSGAVRATGRARPFDSIPSYRLSGSAHRLPGTGAIARALAGAEGSPTLIVGFRVTGRGASADSARVRGRVDLAAVRDTGDRVPIGHATFRLADGRAELKPSLLAGGGTISAVGRLVLGDTLSYELRDGRIERVDLARLSGDTASAPLSGRFSLVGLGTAPAEARVTGRLHLDELRYGERRIERVDAVARLDRGRLRLDAGGALQGGRVELEATGRPFDSTAAYVLRRADLEQVDLGTLLGRSGLAGPVTLRVTGEGRWRGEDRSGRARVQVERSRLGRVEVSGGEANLRLAGQRLLYDASIQTGGGAISLAGDGTPMADAPAYQIRQGRLGSVDLGALLGRPDLHTDINLSFTADVVAGAADGPRATLGAVLLPSRVNRAELTGGSLEGRVQGQAASARLRLDGPDIALDSRLSRTVADSLGTVNAQGTVRVEHLARWTGRPGADGRIESRFSLEAGMDSAGVRAVGGTVDAVGGMGGVRVPAVHLALSPIQGELRMDTLLVRSNVAVLDGGGSLALRAGAQPGRLLLRGTLGDLAPVAELAGADTVAFDSARVSLLATGPAWRWRVEGDADAHGLALGGNLANRITLRAAATLDSTRVAAASGSLRVQDAAYGRLSLRELTAAGGYDSTVALDLALNVGDSVRVDTRIRGAISTARDTIQAEIERLTLDEGGRAWALARPVSFMLGPRVEVHDLSLRAGDRSVTVDGVIDRRHSSDMTLRIAGLDLETLRATGLVPVGGRLDGSLRLSGPAAAPRLQGKMGLAILSPGRRQLGTLSTDLDWTGRGLHIAAAATPTKGGALTVTGALPFRLSLAPRDSGAAGRSEPNDADSVALAVRADSFDLALFQPLLPPEAARGLHGRLQTDARITGSIRAPEAKGAVSLTRGALELPAIKVRYERGELAGRLDGDTLLIDRLRIRTGKKEELAASGVVRLRPLSAPGLELAAMLQDFRLVNSNQLQTAASGRLRVGGTLPQPSVSGTLRLGRTDFFVGAAAAQARVEQVELSPAELRKLARDFGPAVLSHAEQSPGLVERTRLDLQIQMPGQIWIRRTSSPRMDIELAGKLRLTQQPGQDMQFFGQVEPVPGRGTIELNGRQFRLTDGDIDLVGPVDSTKLDVNASYQVPTQGGGDDEGVLINVHAQGRLDSLGLDFTADPSMSQDDIFSYIVTGRPASDNPLFEGQGGNGAGGAGEQVAMSTLSNAISNAAGQGLGFDVFQIRQEPTRGLTLTAGRYLGSRLFLYLQLPLQLGSHAQQSGGSNLGPGFELEYTLRRWLRANLRGGSLSPGFLLRARRAY